MYPENGGFSSLANLLWMNEKNTERNVERKKERRDKILNIKRNKKETFYSLFFIDEESKSAKKTTWEFLHYYIGENSK